MPPSLPCLDLTCLDLPCRGVEFVLKTEDGHWLSWQHGHHGQVSNFYAELPVPMK